jgi:CGNR zinc finger
MLDLAHLRAHLEAQLQAVAEAEQAIAKVQALCGAQLPVERVAPLAATTTLPADPSERVCKPLRRKACSNPECTRSFAPNRGQRYCEPACQHRHAMQRYRARQVAQEDAAQRAQTAAIVEQNRSEGYPNLTWSNGHAAT